MIHFQLNSIFDTFVVPPPPHAADVMVHHIFCPENIRSQITAIGEENGAELNSCQGKSNQSERGHQ